MLVTFCSRTQVGCGLSEREQFHCWGCAGANSLRADSARMRRIEMQAMNGSASPFRSRGRLIGCCMALALALSALVLAPVASAKVAPPVTTYIAAGDSIAFGYSQEKFETN